LGGCAPYFSRAGVIRERYCQFVNTPYTAVFLVMKGKDKSPNYVVPATLLGGKTKFNVHKVKLDVHNPVCNCLKSWLPDKSIVYIMLRFRA
jgi:hypothetical protein